MGKLQVVHKKYGILVSKTFEDDVQMKIFTNLIHVSLVKKEEFDYYDGNCDLIHIPYKFLKNCLITTSEPKKSLTDFYKVTTKKQQTIVDNQ